MINHLHLENFKCFKSENFNLKNLTLFCGSNSSGKSTVIQSLLLLKQSQNFIDRKELILSQPLFDFGTFGDIFNSSAKNENFKIEINSIQFYGKYDSNSSKEETKIPLEKIPNNYKELSLFQKDFVYLSAGRYGSMNHYEMPLYDNDEFNIGVFGEYALYEYNKFIRNNTISNKKFADEMMQIKYSYQSDLQKPQQEELYFESLVKATMQKIYPNFEMKVEKNERHKFMVNDFIVNNTQYRPNNVGFGVSCVLPIIIASCCIKEGGILIVENPEIHLHPKAQSELIKILAILSTCGVQVIIETHSDHIINGLRVLIKELSSNENPKKLWEDVVIYSINNSKVQEIHIDKDGFFDKLDVGFFDQIENDLMRLF